MMKYIRLTKAPLAFVVTFTGILSYLLASQAVDMGVLSLFFALFPFGMAICAINEIQEIKEDSLMVRTEHRPLVNGDLSVRTSIFIIIGLVAFSFIICYLFIGTFAIIALIANFIAYNVLYTPLKKIHETSVLLGAIVGIFAPFIGWVYGGGGFNTALLFLMLYFFIWQMPHFWLLLLRFEKDYNRAGFKSLISKVPKDTVGHFIFIWTLIYSVIVILLALSVHVSITTLVIITILAILVDIHFAKYMHIDKLNQSDYKKSFLITVIYCTLNIIIMVIDKFI